MSEPLQSIVNGLILLSVIGFVGWFLCETAKRVWEILDDIAGLHNERTPYPEPLPKMLCDGCGSGPWHLEWDPESLTRKSRKFYCPNCTGAD